MGIVTDGLLFYYNAKQNNQVAPYLEDLSGNARHAQLVGVIIEPDGSMYFDGVDDHILMPLLPGQMSYTVEFWLNYVSGRSTHCILCFGDENNGVLINEESTNTTIRVAQAAQTRSGSNAGFDASGAMQHYVVRYDASTKTVTRYINDSELSSLAFNNDMVVTAQGVIGARAPASSGTTRLKGHLAAFRMYDREITLSEVAQNAAVGVEVGLDDGGVDVSYEYQMRQSIYKDVQGDAGTKQAVYDDISGQAALVLSVFVERLTVANSEQVVYADQSSEANSRQTVYADVSHDTAVRTIVYADGAATTDTTQRIYADLSGRHNMMQSIYADATALSSTRQTVYALELTEHPLLIVIVPDHDPYRQVVYIDIHIKRSFEVVAMITRAKQIEVRI